MGMIKKSFYFTILEFHYTFKWKLIKRSFVL